MWLFSNPDPIICWVRRSHGYWISALNYPGLTLRAIDQATKSRPKRRYHCTMLDTSTSNASVSSIRAGAEPSVCSLFKLRWREHAKLHRSAQPCTAPDTGRLLRKHTAQRRNVRRKMQGPARISSNCLCAILVAHGQRRWNRERPKLRPGGSQIFDTDLIQHC